MNVISETRWIYPEASLRSEYRLFEEEHPAAWRIHCLGGVRVTRSAGVVTATFDGRHFDWAMCERLLAELDRAAGEISRIDVAVWSDTGAPGDGWIHHSAADLRSAGMFLRSVAAIVIGGDMTPRMQATPMKLARLLTERRGVFDEVVAAWLLDRQAGNHTMMRLFQPERERPNEGLKVVRRFGDNLVFEAYRMATAHQWIEGQRTKMPGADLAWVVDRQLAKSLNVAATQVTRSGEPFLERISGLLLTTQGAVFRDYFRLSLPLNDDDGRTSDAVLMATVW